MIDTSRSSPQPFRPRGLLARLTVRLVAAGLAGGVLAVLAGALLSAVPAAGWGSVAALVGVTAGLGVLALLAIAPGMEPGFAVLGASIVRMAAGIGTGMLLVDRAAGAEKVFWLSFLFVLGCVMIAEVLTARRLLDPVPAAPGTGSKESSR